MVVGDDLTEALHAVFYLSEFAPNLSSSPPNHRPRAGSGVVRIDPLRFDPGQMS